MRNWGNGVRPARQWMANVTYLYLLTKKQSRWPPKSVGTFQSCKQHYSTACMKLTSNVFIDDMKQRIIVALKRRRITQTALFCGLLLSVNTRVWIVLDSVCLLSDVKILINMLVCSACHSEMYMCRTCMRLLSMCMVEYFTWTCLVENLYVELS